MANRNRVDWSDASDPDRHGRVADEILRRPSRTYAAIAPL
jgi:hypothetical protein